MIKCLIRSLNGPKHGLLKFNHVCEHTSSNLFFSLNKNQSVSWLTIGLYGVYRPLNGHFIDREIWRAFFTHRYI